MSNQSLEAAIQAAGGAVPLLRNSQIRPHTFPVKPEFTNWRTEQRAWRDSVALLDQSHHMTDLYLKGPDALKVLKECGINTFENFTRNKAKQFVATNTRGQFIGDCVLFCLEDDLFDMVGHPMSLNWVAYNIEQMGYDVELERDDNSFDRVSGPPKTYRYEIQGPRALSLMAKLVDGDLPEVKFFNMAEFTIAGHQVRALRHGMAGQPGFEMFGPWDEGEHMLETILAAGEEFELVRAGAKAYSTANLESGWIPSPTPAIFSGDDMQGYREWLDVKEMGSLGGSLYSEDIEDYYYTPYELGYGKMVKFDHDFIGREALETIAANPASQRNKVTLVWNSDDVTKTIGSLYGEPTPAKYIEMPKARYALYQNDEVLLDGKRAGVSMDVGYIANEQLMISIATIDPTIELGSEVVVKWGEQPNSTKPAVEEHVQAEIRATVHPCPFQSFARGDYRSA